jgi:C1A family cysteine protease
VNDLKIGRGTRRKNADLWEFFPEVEDQGQLNSSCAFAVLCLVENLEARTDSPPLEASRLFLYQMALRLRGTTDDIGVDLRTTFKSLVRFGAPPQQFWPYDSERFRQMPTDPFLFGFARDYQRLHYFRLQWFAKSNPAVRSRIAESSDETLSILKSFLATGFPFAFGFHVQTTLTRDGLICDTDRSHTIRGGQATVAVGFDDEIRIGSHKGALLIRSSWGSQWGDKGYGWFPYDSVRHSASSEFWGVTSARHIARKLHS